MTLITGSLKGTYVCERSSAGAVGTFGSNHEITFDGAGRFSEKRVYTSVGFMSEGIFGPNSSKGRYEVHGDRLVLHYGHGRAEVHTITPVDGDVSWIRIDGRPYYHDGEEFKGQSSGRWIFTGMAALALGGKLLHEWRGRQQRAQSRLPQ